ncbi:hypothetical protein IMG5_185650 [Ichthyophthirius multifiliis]|uniref:adenylate cyclase n=1 Tax=Ichthyophthirius multifiliis TaxID=5932 RepID=G0R3J3_ICHMU|nr:hypothetical protein IMG5_185650 [Ichthyophthirius multifiliis]EGR27982.1 hypothetical protein IMG5_185650 [Ichthyophthirius multifiliis]|eukprot:XP_004027327.1 hypothetical protein IMG5_185650 [Ichthyophthirius multifiliis]
MLYRYNPSRWQRTIKVNKCKFSNQKQYFFKIYIKQINNKIKVINFKDYKKSFFNKYRAILNLKLSYEPPNQNINEFNGQLRLKKDPKIEFLTNDNFIPRGSTVYLQKSKDWIYGLVLYTGMKTKIMINRNYQNYKNSYLEGLIQYYFLANVSLVIVFAIVSIIVLIAKSKESDFLINYVDKDVANSIRFFTYIILYSQMIPISIYGVLDIVTILSKFKIEKQNKKKKKYFKINDPNVFSNMGHIDYIFMDKFTAIHKKIHDVARITTYNDDYRIEKDDISKFLEGKEFSNKDFKNFQTINQLTQNAQFTLNFIEVDEKNDEYDIYKDNKKEENNNNNIQNIKIQTNGAQFNPINSNQNQSMQTDDFDIKNIQDKLFCNQMENSNKLPLQLKEYLQKELQNTKNPETSEKQAIQYSQISEKQISQNFQQESKSETVNIDKQQPINELSKAQIYTTYQYVQKIQEMYDENNIKGDLSQIIIASLICNHAEPSKHDTLEIVDSSILQNENSVLQFASQSGFTLFTQKNKSYIYFGKKNVVQIDEKMFNYQRGDKKTFSVIVQLTQDKKQSFYLYCKGDPAYMRNRMQISIQESINFDILVQSFQKQGLQPIVYTKKQLSQAQYNKYIELYKQIQNNPQVQEEELKQLGLEIEVNLQFIGLFGLKQRVNQDIFPLINLFQKSNLNLYLLSSETQEQTLNTAIQGFGRQANKQYFQISEDNTEQVWNQVRQILQQLKDIFSTQNQQKIQAEKAKRNNYELAQPLDEKKQQETVDKNLNQKEEVQDLERRLSKALQQNIMLEKINQQYQLHLNGKSFLCLTQDNTLLQHFTFILQFCRVVIGYNIDQESKGKLVNIIKKGMLFNPTVCAIGDGYKDTQMMKNADISIEIVESCPQSHTEFCTGEQFHVLSNGGDIQLSQIKDIKDLILLEGVNNFFQTQNLIYFLFYKSLLFGLSLFYFNWYSSFLGTSMFESMWVFLYDFIFNAGTVILYGLYDTPFQKIVLQIFPSLYVSGLVEKQRVLSNFVLQSVLEGLFQGTLIYYVSIYIVSRSLSIDGYNSDFGIMSLVIIYSVILVFNFKIILTSESHKVRIVWAGQLIVLVLIIVFIFANDTDNFSNWDWVMTTGEIFKRGDTICCLIFNVIVSLIVSHFVNVFMVEYLQPNTYLLNASKIQQQKLNWKEYNNQIIIEQSLKREIDLGLLIKKIFTSQSIIEQSVLDMVSAFESDVTHMQINPYSLKFNDQKLENKYKYERTSSSSSIFRFTYFIIVLIIVVYIIVDTITDKELDQIRGFLRAGFGGFFVLGLILVLSQKFQDLYYSLSFSLLFIGVVFKIILDWIESNFSTSMTTMITTCILTFNFGLNIYSVIILNLMNSCSFIIRIIFIYYDKGYYDQNGTNQDLYNFFLIASFVIMLFYVFVQSVYVIYKSESEKRKYFVAQQDIKNAKEQNNAILSILVPDFVQNKLNTGKFEMADDQDEVAILFADICYFDDMVEEEQNNIVSILDELFRNFDIICEKHGAQKIETVGKTYMAATGIKECEINVSEQIKQRGKGERLVTMAKEMLEHASNQKWGKQQEPIQLKIGINKGEVMAGVIGNPKPQFSLIGDTVNTTSRICAQCSYGKIMITQKIKDEVKNMNHSFKPITFQPKGKDVMTAYEIAGLATQKKFQGILKNLNKHKDAINQIPLSNNQTVKKQNSITGGSNNNSEKQNNIINVLRGKNPINQEKNNKSSQNQILNQQNTEQQQLTIKQNEENRLMTNNQYGPDTEYQDDDDENDEDIDFEEDVILEQGDLKTNILLMIDKNVPNDSIYKFRNQTKKYSLHVNRIMIIFLILLYLISTMFLITVRSAFQYSSAIFIIRGIYIFALVIVLFTLSYSFSNDQIRYITQFILMLGCVPSLLQGYFCFQDDFLTIQIIEALIIYMTSSYIVIFNFIDIIVYSTIISILFIALIFDDLNVTNCFFFWAFIILIIQKSYIYLRNSYKNYNFTSKINKKKDKMQGLVNQLLPAVVKKHKRNLKNIIFFQKALNKLRNQNVFLNNKRELTDEFEDVTILFADIKGFTEFSDKVKDPKKVLKMLKNLFEGFDKLCLKNNVFKLYTIGDCYVVLSFVVAERQNIKEEICQEAKNVVNMGLEMIETINHIRKDYTFLNMRIGIHTSKKIIGGILGTHVVRYDVYGRDIRIANKMESSGDPAKVMISQSTKDWIEKDPNCPYSIVWAKEVEIKSKDKPTEIIQSYFINKKGYYQ